MGVCRRALGCEWGGIKTDVAAREKKKQEGRRPTGKKRDMEAKASKHASKRVHMRVRVRGGPKARNNLFALPTLPLLFYPSLAFFKKKMIV